jgi:hypothetical protein
VQVSTDTVVCDLFFSLRPSPSGEQIGAGRRELHVGSGVMHFQPAPFNGELQAGAVFRGRALVAEQEGAVEFLDIDSAILNWFESVCVFE